MRQPAFFGASGTRNNIAEVQCSRALGLAAPGDDLPYSLAPEDVIGYRASRISRAALRRGTEAWRLRARARGCGWRLLVDRPLVVRWAMGSDQGARSGPLPILRS